MMKYFWSVNIPVDGAHPVHNLVRLKHQFGAKLIIDEAFDWGIWRWRVGEPLKGVLDEVDVLLIVGKALAMRRHGYCQSTNSSNVKISMPIICLFNRIAIANSYWNSIIM